MKICILSEYFYPDSTGGTGTVLSSLVRQLRDRHGDLEIDVITSKNLFRGEAGTLPAQENWDGINIMRLATPQPRKKSVRRRLAANMLFTSAVLRKLMALRKRYDLLLVVTAPPTLPLAARAYARLTGTPYVYLVYDLFLDMAISMNLVRPESRVVKRMKSMQQNWLCSSSRVVVLGRCMRDFVARQYQVPAPQIEVVPIPSNMNLIAPLDKNTRFRTENGLNGFLVLYAGNFARYQDFDTLLEAAKQLRHRKDMTFAFVGDGVKREEIEARVAQDELTNVRLFDFVPQEQLCDMLASADVSLVTLERGAVGLAVPSKFYNILASGRATVAVTDPSSEIAHVLTEAHCGVQVDPENPEQLARVLADLADSPEQVAAMGANARQECEAKYSLNHIGQRFYDIFRDVVRDGAARPGRGRKSLNGRQADGELAECIDPVALLSPGSSLGDGAATVKGSVPSSLFRGGKTRP